MKKAAVVMLFIGFLLVAVSFVLTWGDILAAANTGMGIIGGADGPTFWLFCQNYYWLTILGASVSLGGAVGLVADRLRKR